MNSKFNQTQNFSFSDECSNAFNAYEETTRDGSSNRRCLRCGGEFVFKKTKSSFEVRCSTEGCFSETIRGI